MNRKNQLSRSTFFTPWYKGTPSKSRDRINVFRNDSPQHLPLKFPKGYIIKHSNKNMLTESTYLFTHSATTLKNSEKECTQRPIEVVFSNNVHPN